ncbi:hypothetical protein HOC01_02515 [archaeon]|jgi:hypothetical protein|nr:hypothetical protein [archaeon]
MVIGEKKVFSIKLRVAFALLLISILFLSSCTSKATIFDDCLNGQNTQNSWIASDQRVLCVGVESGDISDSPVCLRKANGEPASSRYFDQMTANTFLYLYEASFNWAISDNDAIEIAAIASDELYGDGIIECQDEDRNECNAGDGFYDDVNDWEGGGASGNCVDKLKFDVSAFLAPRRNYYGIDSTDVSQIREKGGINNIPAMLVCGGKDGLNLVSETGHAYGNYWDLFDADHNPDHLIVTQKIPSTEEGGIATYEVFLCDGKKWRDFEYILNHYDEDGDGAPGSGPFSQGDWDCDDNDARVQSDLTPFNGLGDDNPVEICGDGVSNICLESNLYDRFSNVYDELYPDRDYEDRIPEQPDSCHENPTACESHCLWRDNSCDYLSLQGDVCEGNETECDDSLSLDDIDIEPGFCCGAGLFDQTSEGGYLGDIREWDGGDQEYACLSTDIDLVPQVVDAPESCASGSKWCWISEASNQLKIFTIRSFGEEAYDIVSEGGQQGWLECSADEHVGPHNSIDAELNPWILGANRLYCTKEGDHYAWAECVLDSSSTESESGIVYNPSSTKLREIGDGAVALPIVMVSENLWKVDLTSAGSYTESYQELYSIANFDQTLDFTDYDYLEFFVRYTNEGIIIPENIKLLIQGLPIDITTEEQVIYFDQYVLGYAVNAPLLEGGIEPGGFIHVKVPIGNWLDVSQLAFTPLQASSEIEVANVYLSKSGEDPYICSGVDDTVLANNWLTNLDVSDSETDVDGESICISRYGSEAWLGDYEGYGEVEYRSASCCGNAANEYYSGKSLDTEYGCFNSEPIANGETVMTVEYNVEFQVEDYVAEYQDRTINWVSSASGSVLLENFKWICDYSTSDFCDLNPGECAEDCPDRDDELDCKTTRNSDRMCDEEYDNRIAETGSSSRDPGCKTNGGDLPTFEVFCSEGSEDYREYLGPVDELTLTVGQIGYHEEEYYIGPDDSKSGEDYISYDDSPAFLGKHILSRSEVLSPDGGEYSLELSFESGNSDEVELFYFTPHDQRDRGTTFEFDWDDDFPEDFEVWIMGTVEEVTISVFENETNSDYSYPCIESECTFALPGLPPYKITNKHLDLYEMYYVAEIDGVEQEILVTNDASQNFDEIGAVSVREISQQVLYEYDAEVENGGFYGCNAVDYLEALALEDGSVVLSENYGYCSVQGNFYCSYSDSNFLVSSWSDEGISQVGYAEIEEYTAETEFELKDASYSATQRNHSSSVVSGRNFISNMDFDSTEGADLIFWQLIDSSGNLIEDEYGELDYEIFEVDSGNILRSGRISLAQNEYYSYQDESECSSISLTLVDQNGTASGVSESEWSYFPSAGNSYLRIEVVGPCEYSYPYLQLVDDLGASEGYVGLSEEERDDLLEAGELHADGGYDQEYPVRSGAACCPENMCYNGYACVEEMSGNSYLAEDTGKESFYRCIEGDWNHLEPQYDWNNEEFGFCEQSEQCYVTSSLSEGASSEATLEDFYDGIYPTCVNDGEYLLDHYCDAGSWTSRTKFVASQLIEFAQSEDYVLYCSYFDDTFVDYDKNDYNYVNYLAGEVSAESSGTADLGTALGGSSSSSTSETTEVCFSALENSETGRRLVSQDENTCINAVCVLKYKSGDNYAAAFGASMNVDASEEQSFLIPLGIGVSDLDTFCDDGTGASGFISCSEEMWYASELGSLIYAKEGISISSSIIDRVTSWFSSLFGSTEAELSEDFLAQAQNFNRLYIASVGDYSVRGIQEIVSENETVSVEFDGFESPLCDFINNAPEEYIYEYQWPAEPKELVHCELSSDGVYRVLTATNTEFWWNELTANLRIEANN